MGITCVGTPKVLVPPHGIHATFVPVPVETRRFRKIFPQGWNLLLWEIRGACLLKMRFEMSPKSSS